MISRVGGLIRRALPPPHHRHPSPALNTSWRLVSVRTMGVQVKYAVKSSPVDVNETPVLIVGQLQDLKGLDYGTISHKLGSQVPAEVRFGDLWID